MVSKREAAIRIVESLVVVDTCELSDLEFVLAASDGVVDIGGSEKERFAQIVAEEICFLGDCVLEEVREGKQVGEAT